MAAGSEAPATPAHVHIITAHDIISARVSSRSVRFERAAVGDGSEEAAGL